MSPRPEIVLPPGFALRIDYDPSSRPASLLITALRDETPVGQAHVDPREVGLRLRLEVAEGVPSDRAEASQLRLTPQRAMHAISLEVVRPAQPPPVPSPQVEARPWPVPAPMPAAATEVEQAMATLQQLARDGLLGGLNEVQDDVAPPRPLNALVWLEHGGAVVLPSSAAAPEEQPWVRVQRAIRAVSEAAAELLVNPLRLRDAEDGWASWRASWRGAQPASGASD